MANDGRSGAEAPSGHSAEPEPISVVSAQEASVPNAESLHTHLTRPEGSAFLALFAGAQSHLMCFVDGASGKELPVSFGKAECEWVPFRETWQERFPALGLTTFEESGPRPALGMVEGSTWTEIHIGVTDFGLAVREAFWNAVNASAGEAGTAETTKIGSVHEHATAEGGDAQHE